MAKKTLQEKFDSAPEPHVEPMKKDMWGMSAGEPLLISSPKEIEAEMHNLKSGERLSIAEFRTRLAHKHGARNTCPLTTSIFLRIVAELNFVKHQKSEDCLAPFWRVISENDAIVKKLSFDFAEYSKMD